MKIKGDYMKPFMSFYDPKSMDVAFSAYEVERFEIALSREVEIVIRQLRSSKN